MTTLKTLLFLHDNNYGFDPIRALSSKSGEVSNLSVVVPYFETGVLIDKTLYHLFNSINNVKDIYKGWEFEVIVIDDGSIKKPIAKYLLKEKYPNLRVFRNNTNQGRTVVRNKGLHKSKYEKCLFMDSDILIDSQLILNHLKIHAYLKTANAQRLLLCPFSNSEIKSTHC